MKNVARCLIVIILSIQLSFGQTIQKLEFNRLYENISLDTSDSLVYALDFQKDSLYRIEVVQQGVDVQLILADSKSHPYIEHDSPNGENGPEQFDYLSTETKAYYLTIKALEKKPNGKITIYVKKFSVDEIHLIEKIRQEVEPENRKKIQTLDLDHFWQAFDSLKVCKTHLDSVSTIQRLYLDRATNGLKEFMVVRDFSAEKFVKVISRYPKFYGSVKKNTLEIKKVAPELKQVFENFQKIYPNFQAFTVCFAIGLGGSGGTTGNGFVLIGSEVSVATKETDLSELNSAFAKVLSREPDIIQNIKNIVSHECVHTQQAKMADQATEKCSLLRYVIREGASDFIGELIVGSQINGVAHEYGNAHEQEIWDEFQKEMCSSSLSNWLYNYSTAKDKPADLGYYIGYRIAKTYYENTSDKKQAVADILEMTNPVEFLEKSGYLQKSKN
jgi:hypothetical protein